MADLVFPTLDLFLYDLRNGLGETNEAIAQNRAQFAAKLPIALRAQIAQRDGHFEAEYQELLPRRYETFTDESNGLPIQGYYYPVRLNDAYGLLLDASVDNQVAPQSAGHFEQLKAEVTGRLHQQSATIGQTWMLSGWLPEAQTQSVEAIAQDCYKAFLPDGNWRQDLEGQGTLLGAPIFELWRYRSTLPEGSTASTSLQSLQQNQHVVVIIFPNQATAEKAATLYDDWLRLFSFRNKILWAYSQSRLIKQLIKTDFTVVQSSQQNSQSFDDFREELGRIQEALNHYKVNLIQLDFQGRTVDINLSNYTKRLRRIEKEAGSETDLAFLTEFAELVKNKYLLQITKDSENMELGLRLLEDAINATQSRLEVEKAERDRNFQRLIKYWGTGLAAAAVVPQYINTEDDPGNLESKIEAILPGNVASLVLMKPVIGMAYVLILAALFTLVVGGLTALWNVSCRFWKGCRRPE